MKKKVLYMVSSLKRCGPTNQLYYIVKNLDREMFQPHILTLSPEPQDSIWESFATLGVSIESLNLSRFKGMFFAKRKVQAVVARILPDLIHSQGVRADQIAAAVNPAMPMCSTVRNYPQIDLPLTYGKLAGSIMTRFQTRALRQFSSCVGVSESVSENLRSRFSLTNVKTVWNGIPTEIYGPESAEGKTFLRGRLGLPLNSRIWVSSGHLNKRKDPMFLVSCWRRFFDGDHSNQLVFLGNGPELEKCQVLSAKGDNISFIGRVSDVASYLKAADYYVSSSLAEGLPNSVLEAMACGLPVVLSNIQPHLEILKKCNQGGVSFEVGSQKDFEQSVDEISSMEYSLASKSVVGSIHQYFDARLMSKSYQLLYLDLLRCR